MSVLDLGASWHRSQWSPQLQALQELLLLQEGQLWEARKIQRSEVSDKLLLVRQHCLIKYIFILVENSTIKIGNALKIGMFQNNFFNFSTPLFYFYACLMVWTWKNVVFKRNPFISIHKWQKTNKIYFAII